MEKKYFSTGKAEGKSEGKVETLIKLLTLKFGEPSQKIQVQVQQASSEDLEKWTERILTASTVEEVFDV